MFQSRTLDGSCCTSRRKAAKLSPSPPPPPTMPEGISSRLRFVDGDEGEGLWSTATDVLPKYADGVRCAISGVAFFKWQKAWNHDLVKLASKEDYDNCNVNGAGAETRRASIAKEHGVRAI